MTETLSPGRLVHVRGRDWVVQPSDDVDVLVLKPLGGTEDETTVIYLPLAVAHDVPRDAQFALPTIDDIGDFRSARLLYEAARLSFRNGAGPFRALGKISFRPRSYQMVPLVMALKQATVRLLIADDVGVGKTIEALLIAREMLERRLIRRFAIVCPPHLCEQWQSEIKAKLDLDAVIIRSNTQAALEREIPGDVMLYHHFPYQILSIDYIKNDSRRLVFISEAPELVIVDEAHTATEAGEQNRGQQQRHALIAALAAKTQQHLVLLTATPHSGKPEQFQSLLKLLDAEFAGYDVANLSESRRQRVAQHFVQRTRADVMKWLGDETPFPRRESVETLVPLSQPYAAFFDDLLQFTRAMVNTGQRSARQQRVQYWTALALLRAAVSSPTAGAAVLTTRLKTLQGDSAALTDEHDGTDEYGVSELNPVGDAESFLDSDSEPTQLSDEVAWNEAQRRNLRTLRLRLEALANPRDDAKLRAVADLVNQHLSAGYQPVIFCRYILTATYLGEHLPALLAPAHAKQTIIAVVTSEDPDEVRRQRIAALGDAPKRVLVATDCLSEGINLQDSFTAVVHYDLPWNPNRLEQREGRVDRFGQSAPIVKTCLLYSNADIDGIVLDVLLRKVREIHRATGIHVPFPHDSQSIIDTITQSLLTGTQRIRTGSDARQLRFDIDALDGAADYTALIARELDAAADREKSTRSLFAQHRIKAQDIEQDLRAVDAALGDPAAVEQFVVQTLQAIYGVSLQAVDSVAGGYRVVGDLPHGLAAQLPAGAKRLAFVSPTPKGYTYIGRNHPFVEQLCQTVLSHTMERVEPRAARVSVIRTTAVPTRTVVTLLRCRTVIEATTHAQRFVAEEMIVSGWQGSGSRRIELSEADAQSVLFASVPAALLSREAQQQTLADTLHELADRSTAHAAIALEHAQTLVAAHERFSKLLRREHYSVVQPVLPMDVLGVYVLLPV